MSQTINLPIAVYEPNLNFSSGILPTVDHLLAENPNLILPEISPDAKACLALKFKPVRPPQDVRQLKFLLIALLADRSLVDTKLHYRRLRRLKLRFPNWQTLARQLVRDLYPFSSDQTQTRILKEKLDI